MKKKNKEEISLEILAELPEDLQAEIRRAYNIHNGSSTTSDKVTNPSSIGKASPSDGSATMRSTMSPQVHRKKQQQAPVAQQSVTRWFPKQNNTEHASNCNSFSKVDVAAAGDIPSKNASEVESELQNILQQAGVDFRVWNELPTEIREEQVRILKQRRS